jgi:hypothetical protein
MNYLDSRTVLTHRVMYNRKKQKYDPQVSLLVVYNLLRQQKDSLLKFLINGIQYLKKEEY